MRLIFWLLFLMMTGVYLTMALWSIPKITADAGGLLAFDLRPMGYSFEEAQAFLAALSEQGRDFYLNVQQMLDRAYPALFAVVMVLAFRQIFSGAAQFVASVVALAGAGFDYMENASVAVMLRAGGGLNEAIVSAASRWTMLKSASVTVALILLIIGLVRAVLAKRKAKQ